MSNNTPTPPNNQLTRETFTQMVVAMQTLHKLANKAIKEPNDEAEISGQRQFLARAFLTHGAEFLGCWITVTDEYQPLIQSFAFLQQRSANFLAMRNQKFAESQAEVVATSDGESAAESKVIVPAFK